MTLLSSLTWVELAGYTAALLVFITFYMKTMVPLRIVAMSSNVAFMTYALGAQLYPIFILHSILLPLNYIRLLQIRRLIEQVRQTARNDLSMEWLMPFLIRQKFKTGAVLFRKGDPARQMYLVLAGSIRLVELEKTVGPGALIGEIGIFSPTGDRMDTAVCETDVELGVMDDDKVIRLYYQNPAFSLHLVRLIIQRLRQDYVSARAGTAKLKEP